MSTHWAISALIENETMFEPFTHSVFDIASRREFLVTLLGMAPISSLAVIRASISSIRKGGEFGFLGALTSSNKLLLYFSNKWEFPYLSFLGGNAKQGNFRVKYGKIENSFICRFRYFWSNKGKLPYLEYPL